MPPSRPSDTCPSPCPQFSPPFAHPQPGQGLAWEPRHWGPFPSFSTDLLCDLGRSLPLFGVLRTPKHSLLMEESSCLRLKITLPTPAATTAKGLYLLKTFSQGPAICHRSAKKMSLVYTQTATPTRPTLAPHVPGLPHCPRLAFSVTSIWFSSHLDRTRLLGSCSGWNLGNVQVTSVCSLVPSFIYSEEICQMSKRCSRDSRWSWAPPCSSGRPGVCPGPRLCPQVLSEADAQRSCSRLLCPGSNFIPILWFRVPGELVAVVVRKDGGLPPLP